MDLYTYLSLVSLPQETSGFQYSLDYSPAWTA